jgi:hypothetical protein
VIGPRATEGVYGPESEENRNGYRITTAATVNRGNHLSSASHLLAANDIWVFYPDLVGDRLLAMRAGPAESCFWTVAPRGIHLVFLLLIRVRLLQSLR